MSESTQESNQDPILELAVAAFTQSQIFKGLAEDGLPTSATFTKCVNHFFGFDNNVRKRLSHKGPIACYVFEGSIGWFAGEDIVTLAEKLKDRERKGGGLQGTNYMAREEIYTHVVPVAGSCAGELCLAMADLKRTYDFQGKVADLYGCKEIEELTKRILPALDHLEEGRNGLDGVPPNASASLAEIAEQQKLLRLWELLEIAIPRMKENDKGPLTEVMRQLLRPNDPNPDQDIDVASELGEESEQGFVFRVRQMLGKRLSNTDRAFLSDTRNALIQSRREFLTIRAFISTYHQMILAPRAYEEAEAAVQYALLSKQRRYASRACHELSDQSPKEMAELNHAESTASEAESKIDPDRILSELKQTGSVTPPKEFIEQAATATAKPAEPKKARSGMHSHRR